MEQIIQWLAKSLWPLLKQNAIPIGLIWAVAATIYLIFKIKKLFRTKAEPDITFAQIEIEPFDLPSFRFIKGSFVVVNSGHQPCKVTQVQVLHESSKFELTDLSEDIIEDITLRNKKKIGIQLPLQIKGNKTSKIFFVGSHNIETLEELPDTISLEITIDCRKDPFVYNMKHESGKKTYIS